MSSRPALLLIVLCALLLASCTTLHNWAFGSPEDDAKQAAKEKNAVGPSEGDRKVVSGVEYVYTRNNRYKSDPYQPEFIWLKKDDYLQSRDQAIKERMALEKKETDELRKRLAQLEQKVNEGLPPEEEVEQIPGQPRERRWEVFGMSATGVSLLFDRRSITRGSDGTLQFLRRRTFSDSSYQKEIISREEVDCRKNRYRTLETEGIFWDGRHETSKTPTSWSRFYDDTTEDRLFMDTCKSAAPAGKRS